MTESKGSVQLKLTPEQQEQVRQAAGKLTDTLEMRIEELEEGSPPLLDLVSRGAHSPAPHPLWPPAAFHQPLEAGLLAEGGREPASHPATPNFNHSCRPCPPH
jgi:hypothetical protein